MAAGTAAVTGMGVLTAGMEEAVIRAALVGMALVRVGLTLALAGMVVAVTGTAAAGTVGVVAGIIEITVVVGELAPRSVRCWPWTRGSARDGSLLQWLRLRLQLPAICRYSHTYSLVLV